MVAVYILHSTVLDKYYVGLTASVPRRMGQHRRGQSVWSSRAADWKLVYTRSVPTFAEARTLEKAIKARGARRFLADQLPNPANAGQG